MNTAANSKNNQYGSVQDPEANPQAVECREWGRTGEEDPLLRNQEEEDEEEDYSSNNSGNLCVAVLTLLVSIPALIGMWCWPALVIPLLGGTVTSASRHLSHYWNWGIDVVLLGAVTLYVSKGKKKGPTYLVAIGSLLILADPTRHVLNDLGVSDIAMFQPECPVRSRMIPERTCQQNSDCGNHDCGGGYYSVHPGEDCFTCWQDTGMCSEGAETFRCLSPWGWFFTIVCTYLGFALFFVGVLWNSSAVFERIGRQWK